MKWEGYLSFLNENVGTFYIYKKKKTYKWALNCQTKFTYFYFCIRSSVCTYLPTYLVSIYIYVGTYACHSKRL